MFILKNDVCVSEWVSVWCDRMREIEKKVKESEREREWRRKKGKEMQMVYTVISGDLERAHTHT